MENEKAQSTINKKLAAMFVPKNDVKSNLDALRNSVETQKTN